MARGPDGGDPFDSGGADIILFFIVFVMVCALIGRG